MPTDNTKANAGGGEQKQRKLTYTGEKFQKLIHRKEEGQHRLPSQSSRLASGEGESKHRRLTVSSEMLQKIKIKKEEGQNSRSSSKEKAMMAMSKTEPKRSTKSMNVGGGAVGQSYIPIIAMAECKRSLLRSVFTACFACTTKKNAISAGLGGGRKKLGKQYDSPLNQPVKNPDEDCEMVTALDTDNLTKVQFQFLEAARTNRCDILGMIIEQHACRLDLKNNLDRTALHLAAAQGCFEAVQLLVNAKASVDIPDKHGMTPMFWAAYKDYIDIVVYLIKHGASVHRKTKRGYTLLHVLAKADSIKTLETLVRSKYIRNFQELDLNDWTPLMVATMSGSLRATTVLSRIGNLEKHVDKVRRRMHFINPSIPRIHPSIRPSVHTSFFHPTFCSPTHLTISSSRNPYIIQLPTNPFKHLTVYSSTYPSFHPSIRPSFHSCIHPPIQSSQSIQSSLRLPVLPPIQSSQSNQPFIHPFSHPAAHLPVHLTIQLTIQPPILRFIQLSIYLPTQSFIQPPIHRSMQPFI
ncbi:Ankyrin repeat and death domain-containing protein 1B [Taenia solium]|eukprot:TsM_000747600 transcript=TsM_000747600 gene=TsM_000747600